MGKIMSFFRSLVGGAVADSTESGLTQPESWLVDLLGGARTTSGEVVNERTAFLNSNVYTCVNIRGDDIAKLPIHVFKKKSGKDGKAQIERDQDHPVARLLYLQSNPLMTAFVWKRLMEIHVDLWGNAYSWIEFDEWGYPAALWPLDPSATRVDIDPATGEVWYVTNVRGKGYKLPPSAVLHIKASSLDGLKGMSPIAVLREEIGVQQASNKFLGSFYQNGTTTRGIVKHPGAELSKDAKKKVREEWEMANSGMPNAFKVAVLQAGWDFQELGMPLKDAQFIETKKFGILEVAKVYKIPAHKLNQLDRATFSNIEQQSMDYVKNTLLPIATNWEQEIVVKLFTLKEQKKYYVKFNLAAELRGDSQARANFYKTMIEAGVMTMNEARALEEYDYGGELADQLLVSLNFTTLENLAEYQRAKAGIAPTAEGGDKNDGTTEEKDD